MMGSAYLPVAVDFRAAHFQQPVLVIGGAGGIGGIVERVMLLVVDVHHVRRTASVIFRKIEYRLFHGADIGIQVQLEVRAAHRVAALFQYHRALCVEVTGILEIQQAIRLDGLARACAVPRCPCASIWLSFLPVRRSASMKVGGSSAGSDIAMKVLSMRKASHSVFALA